MTRQVLHKQIYRPNRFGGTTNTTLCRRVRQGDDMNVADTDEQVTCKFCLKALPRHQQAERLRQLHNAREIA